MSSASELNDEPERTPVFGTDAEDRFDASVEDDDDTKTTGLSEILEWVAVIVIAVTVAFVLKTWVLQAFSIPSGSMTPTLLEGDRVLVSKLDYRFSEPGRSHLVVFDNLDPSPADPDQIIKRVVAVEGDVVDDQDGDLLVNGEVVGEPYLEPGTFTEPFDALEVPEDHVFVLGDNRGNSKDSRIVGPIPIDAIVGRAHLVVWPLNRLDRV